MRVERRVACFALAVASLWATACASRAADAELAEARRRIELGADPFTVISAIDQEHPADPRIKTELASFLLLSGRIDEADAYLAKAEVLAKGNADVAAVAALRARIAVERGDWVSAKRLAGTALKRDDSDASGAVFPLARALAASGDRDGARTRFSEALKTKATLATRSDWRFWIRFLSEDEPESALDALAAYESAFPYEPGSGLVESSLRERTGDKDGAVLAAFKDGLNAYEAGAVGIEELEFRLSELERVLADSVANPAGGGLAALETARAYLRADWAAAARALTRVTTRSSAKAWIGATAGLAPGDAASERAFVEAETAFGFLPSYRLRFASAFAGDRTRLASVRAACETGIDLAPSGPLAVALRRELGRALGIDVAESGKLRTRGELEAAGYRAAASRDPAFLAPAIGTFELPDNDYTLFAVGLVKGFASEPVFRSALERELGTSSGRRAERLRYALAK